MTKSSKKSSRSQSEAPKCCDPSKDISTVDCYHGLLPRADIVNMLKENGDYLVRSTEPVVGEPRKYVVSCMKDQNLEEAGIKHLILHNINSKWIGGKKSFETIFDLVSYYHGKDIPLASASSEVYLKRAIKRQSWELNPNDIRLTKKLGEGNFGEVHEGIFMLQNMKIPVAVKLAKLEQLNKEQINEIMTEARLMRDLMHENVVDFYGVCAVQEPLMLVMGLASHGSLEKYLKENDVRLSTKDEIALQAGWGVEYLHNIGILHRDLACRNCLYGDGKVKIADFGLSTYGASYQMDPHKAAPIKALSPEAISTLIYTTKSEVWAYGVMCWQIYMNAEEPYSGMTHKQYVPMIKDGHKLSFPAESNMHIAKLISDKCWAFSPNDRLDMRLLVKHMHRLVPHARLPKAVERPNYPRVVSQSTITLQRTSTGNSNLKKWRTPGNFKLSHTEVQA